MTKLELKIQQALIATRSHCAFKEAWLPKGWACVEIVSFSKELAKSLKLVAK